MKIRHGFVSNSSSSSFIIGIAKVDDSALLEKMKAKFEGRKYDGPQFLTGADIVEQSLNKWSDISVNDGRVTVSGGGNGGADVTIPFDYEATYVVVNINNNEGDGAFMADEDDYDIDYDIDIDWFPEWQQELFETVSHINGAEIIFGAERNG